MTRRKKIILVISDTKGIGRAFITNDFQYLLLNEAIELVKKRALSGVHLVTTTNGTYVRGKRGREVANQLMKFAEEVLYEFSIEKT